MAVLDAGKVAQHVLDGASIVAEAVDITAESTAPKKSTRSHIGM